MSRMEVPFLFSFFEQPQDLGLDVTSRAVVGSSAMSSAGRQESSMAIMTAGACLRLADAGIASPPCGHPESVPAPASGPPLPGGRLSSRWWSMMTSRIWSPMRKTGLSDVIGSWKIMEISLPERRASDPAEGREYPCL